MSILKVKLNYDFFVLGCLNDIGRVYGFKKARRRKDLR